MFILPYNCFTHKPDLRPPQRLPAVAGINSLGPGGPANLGSPGLPELPLLQGTVRPLPDVDFFFPCYLRYFINELSDLLLKSWLVHIPYNYFTMFSKLHISLHYISTNQVKVCLIGISYVCNSVPLQSKLCDMGGGANISHSALLPCPRLHSTSEKDRADSVRTQICCQGRNTYFGNSLQDPGQENKTQTCKSHGTTAASCLWLSTVTREQTQALQTGRKTPCKYSVDLRTLCLLFAVS